MPQQKKPGRKKSRIKDRRRVADHYTLQARKQDYPARSIFKLKEIDQKYQIVKQGYRVLDLGTTPGSWAKYAAQKVGSGGRVIGVDLNSPDIEYTDPMRFIQADVSETAPDLLIKEGPFDLVLSDMAPKTTGHKNVDQIKSAQTCYGGLFNGRKLCSNRVELLYSKYFRGMKPTGCSGRSNRFSKPFDG
jgi:23S rRNA U2552 (ribose-2'-O)-methylase RlmE/FtsJ